ncbi:DUF4854 domain-containing protein [Bifidobacterium leontopitheci]|uniref:Protocadherin domain n=1 Tax=Bifidobacterium leontopitheci TaxID=2650774 RepID=A0A6I1GU34_9BIFI|nr:DUF4854 domain-containing protein [Bifidobacterium leontopitheci]KAB7789981.1 protocadherin domain [Bifidobacterium leontopitheci]
MNDMVPGAPQPPYGNPAGAPTAPMPAGSGYERNTAAPYGQGAQQPYGQEAPTQAYGAPLAGSPSQDAPTAAYGQPLAAQGAPTQSYGNPLNPQEAPTAAYGAPLAAQEAPTQAYGSPLAPQSGYGYGNGQPGVGYGPQGGAPYGQPPVIQPEYEPVPPHADRTNTCALVGLILSFFVALPGLIVSIVGLSQIKKSGEKGKGLAIGGIVVSVIEMVLSVLLTVALFTTGFAGYKIENGKLITPQATTSQSTTAEGKSGSDSSDQSDGNTDSNGSDSNNSNGSGDSNDSNGSDSNSNGSDSNSLDNSLQQGDSDLEQDLNGSESSGSSTSGKPTVEEFANSSAVQSQIKNLSSQFAGAGIQISIRGEGNTLVYDYLVPDQYATQAEGMVSQLDSSSSSYKQVAATLNQTCDTGGNAQVRIYVHTTGGKTLYNKSFSE